MSDECDPRAEPFPSAAFDSNMAAVYVRAAVEATAGALAGLVGGAWERDAAGREVGVTKRTYIIVGTPFSDWSAVYAGHASWKHAADARALSKALATKSIALAAGDTAGYYDYELFEAGRRIEKWVENDGESTFRSTFRDESWTDGWGPFEYLNTFFRDQGALELGWSYYEYTGPPPRSVVGAPDGVARIDVVAAPPRTRKPA